jgi:hypothetical protein
MQTFLDGFMIETLLQDVRVRYHRFKTKFFPDPPWRNNLRARIYDWKKQRSLHRTAFGL